MSLKRTVVGKMKCSFQKNSLTILLTRDSPFDDGKFHHIVCAFDGTKKYMWVDGDIDSKSSFIPTRFPSESAYKFGWNNGTDKPFEGDIGAIRVWHDIGKLKAALREMHPDAAL